MNLFETMRLENGEIQDFNIILIEYNNHVDV